MHHVPLVPAKAASAFFLMFIILRGSLVAHAAPAATASTRPPNIVFILADDLGYGDVGCFGQTRIRTPHIDRLAAQGVRFTQFYAGDTVCTPSRCVLMTGQHVGHASMRGNGDERLGFRSPTVAALLKQAGYDTAIFGKWGLANQPDWPGVPNKQGFEMFFGYLNNNHAHNYYPSYLWRNDQRVALKNVVPNEGKMGQGVASEKVEYSNDLFADEAVKYIDAHKDRPFFLYLPFTIPHANDEAKNAGTETPELGDYAKENWAPVEKGYAAMVTRLDSYVGRVMERLKADGLDDNTLVIFTSDNGPHKEGGHDPAFFQSGGPLRGIKRDLYEGGIREPTVIRWPGHTHAGTTSDFIGGFQDVLPTLVQVACGSVPVHAGVDGISFVSAIEGRTDQQPKHDALYWEFHEGKTSQAVRQGEWKAVRIPAFTGAIQLFDLSKDVHEDNDVAAEHADVVARMEQIMKKSHTPNEGAVGVKANRAAGSGRQDHQ